jgi:hypothetical protein
MATIAQIRAQYPQYRDMSDAQLANALYTAHYSDMPRADFDRKLGLGGNTTNPVMGAITTFNRSVPLMDEAADTIQTGANLARDYKFDPKAGLSSVGDALGDAWSKARASSKAASQDFQSAHPHVAALVKGAAMAAQAAPAFASGGATVAPEAAAAGNGAKGLLGTVLRKATGPTAKAAVTGGLLAGINGLTDEGDLSQRVDEANRAIPVGMAVGAAVPTAVKVGAKAVNAVADRFAPAADQAMVKAGNVLQSRAPDAVSVPAPEDGQLPFEAWGGGGKSLARAVANVPGPGQDIAEAALGARRAGAPDRMLAATQDALGGDGGEFHAVRNMLDATRKAQAAPLYQAAEQTPINAVDYQTHLQPLLETDIGRKAVASAEKIAKAQEILTGKPSGWTSNIINNGQVEPVTAPNAQTLDYIAQGWDEALKPYQNQFGKLEGLSPEGRTMVQLRQEFVKRLGDLVPANAEARAAWSGPTSMMDAMQRGRAAVGSRLDPELISANNETLTDDQIQAQRLGVARGVSDQLRGGNPQRIMRAISQDQVLQDRLRAAFADDNAFNAFMGAAKGEAAQQQSYNGILSGSRTTPLREDITAANDAGGEGDALDKALNIAKRRLGGQSFRSQAVHGALNMVDKARTPALNDPEVSRLLGEVLFKGRAPRDVINEAIAQRAISPNDALRLMPILSAGAGASAGRPRASAGN